MIQSYCKCSKPKDRQPRLSWWSALLIVILPKCPFCIMAYSSAITMCGGSAMYVADNNWVSYIPIILSCIIIVMIILNFRDRRTYYAVATGIAGMFLVILTHQTLLGSTYYYLGTTLLTIAIWINGSLFSILGIKKSDRSYFKA